MVGRCEIIKLRSLIALGLREPHLLAVFVLWQRQKIRLRFPRRHGTI
jgi:hypothetical protein